MKKYKEFMFAPDELPVYMADPKVIFALTTAWMGEIVSQLHVLLY